MIGEANIDLANILEDCVLVKQSLTLNKSYYNDVLKKKGFQKLEFDEKDPNRFWLNLHRKDPKTDELKNRGKVKVQIDVLPAEVADKNPCGKARDSPNHSPMLPQPEGRIELTLNPIKMFNQLVGAEMRRKILTYFLSFMCCLLCIYMLPSYMAAKLAQWL